MLLPPAAAHAQGVLTVDQNWVNANGTTVSGSYSNINVQTTTPLTITNCALSGQGDLITVPNGGRVTVTYTTGTGTGSSSTGCFLYADHPASLNVHNCDAINNGFGIWVSGYNGDGTTGNTIQIDWNRFRNINGQAFKPGRGNNPHAVQLSGFGNLPGIDIGHNEIVNDPFASYVDDNINISAGGTPGSHINVHDNYIQGAYNPDPHQQIDASGSGVICDGGAAYVDVQNNQVVSTSNVGISIAGGHDNQFWNNRMISSGLLPDGSAIWAQNNGAQLVQADPNAPYYNNYASHGTTGNVIGWMRRPYTEHNATGNLSRADANFQNQPDDEIGKQNWWGDYSGPNLTDESNEARSWAQTLANNNWWVGDNLVIDPGFEAQSGSHPGGTLGGHWRADVGGGAGGAGTDIDQPGNAASGHVNAWVHNPATAYGAYAAQDGIAVQPNTTYTLTAQCWDVTGGAVGASGAQLGAWSDDWSRQPGNLWFTPSTSGYAPASVTFTTGPNDTRIHIEIGIAGQTRDAWMRIDDVKLSDPVVRPTQAPSGLRAVAGAAGTRKVSLTWNGLAGANGYRVSRSTSSGGVYSQIATATGTGYTNAGLTAGITYYYKVAGANLAGVGPQSGAASARAQ